MNSKDYEYFLLINRYIAKRLDKIDKDNQEILDFLRNVKVINKEIVKTEYVYKDDWDHGLYRPTGWD